MSELKTLPNADSAEAFIRSVEDPKRRDDGLRLLKLYESVTGEKARMWGTSIVGFGMYHYKSDRSSQEGDWPLVAFSPRKQSLSLYFAPNFDKYSDLLDGLGKHKLGKGCLYINKLSDVDMTVLEQLIRQGYSDAKSSLT